ncbi:hypothetical protein BpHYR1_034733 [Brachionus plicatilis]|uniref:Uncharacterized protein n=1 Tax=Brachionus plicatilis TaxID=10195 RepID=A0A3M7Q596_BRAPC|nr:hypothetical protein BpHYR1_034733 [Brachionus plicatilis]
MQRLLDFELNILNIDFSLKSLRPKTYKFKVAQKIFGHFIDLINFGTNNFEFLEIFAFTLSLNSEVKKFYNIASMVLVLYKVNPNFDIVCSKSSGLECMMEEFQIRNLIFLIVWLEFLFYTLAAMVYILTINKISFKVNLKINRDNLQI